MTERDLKQIGINNRELEKLMNRYKELKYDVGISGQEITGMPFVGKVFDTSMCTVDEACDIESEYKELYYRNELLIRKARRYIEAFPDWKIRMLLTLRYINNMQLYEIAPAMGITDYQCKMILRVHFNNVF